MNWQDRNGVNEIGAMLATIRHDEEGMVLIGFGAHGPSQDCPGGHVSATVRKSGEEATSEAVSLQDALYLARAKVNEQIEKRRKEREEAKAKKGVQS